MGVAATIEMSMYMYIYILHKNTGYSMSVVQKQQLFTMKDWDMCGTEFKASERLIKKPQTSQVPELIFV